MNVIEKTIEKNTVFSGRIITVRDDRVLLPDGNEARREVVAHNGGVCVLLITPDDSIYLVSQYRYPYSEVLLEIPAGKLEKGENPYAAAMREALEETGCKAKELHSLGEFYPTPGYCGEVIHIYMADDFETGEQKLDEDEFLNVVKVPFSRAVEMVMNGEIKDGKTQTAILKLALMRNGGKI